MKARLIAALLLLSTPAQADLISITISGHIDTGSSFTAHWTVDTGCTRFAYVPNCSLEFITSQHRPILAAAITVGAASFSYDLTSGSVQASDNLLEFEGRTTQRDYSRFEISGSVTGPVGIYGMNQVFNLYSTVLPGDLNVPFSISTTPIDLSGGAFTAPGLGSGLLTPEHITLTNLSAVPGPMLGSGLPALMMLLAWWLRERRR